jgi:hypothetical protein
MFEPAATLLVLLFLEITTRIHDDALDHRIALSKTRGMRIRRKDAKI